MELEIGLIRLPGMTAPGKTERSAPVLALPVLGSYNRKLGLNASTSLKSPVRILAVGTVRVEMREFFSRLRSQPPK